VFLFPFLMSYLNVAIEWPAFEELRFEWDEWNLWDVWRA